MKRIINLIVVISMLFSYQIFINAEETHDILLSGYVYELEPGDTVRIKATYSDSFETVGFTYESSNSQVAFINDEGNVSAVAEGSARITVSDGEISKSCMVFVSQAANGITLNSKDIGLAVNDTYKLEAYLSDEYTGQNIIWKTDNSKIASVTQTGLVTGIAIGRTIIRAELESDSEIYAECSVLSGKINQYDWFAASSPEDNSDDSMWQYGYVLKGENDITKYTEYAGYWRYPAGSSSIRNAEMEAKGKTEPVRMFRAPASGVINLTVNNTNTFYNDSGYGKEVAPEPAEAKLQVVFKGEVLREVDLISAAKPDGGYYPLTTYNGTVAEETSATTYKSGVSLRDEIGNCEINVHKGDLICIILRNVTGLTRIANWSGGFCVEYKSNKSVDSVSLTADELKLRAGEITDAFGTELYGKACDDETGVYISENQSIARVSKSGRIKGEVVGITRIFTLFDTAGLMNYTDITVEAPVLDIVDFKHTEKSQSIDIDAEIINNSGETTCVSMEVILRDELGKPITVISGKQIEIEAAANAEISAGDIVTNDAKRIDIYFIQFSDGIKNVWSTRSIDI